MFLPGPYRERVQKRSESFFNRVKVMQKNDEKVWKSR